MMKFLFIQQVLIVILGLYNNIKEEINKPNKITGETPLIRACFNRNKKIVEYILNSKLCEIDKTDSQQKTALYYSCYRGYDDIVNILLDAGASIFPKSGQPVVY